MSFFSSGEGCRSGKLKLGVEEVDILRESSLVGRVRMGCGEVKMRLVGVRMDRVGEMMDIYEGVGVASERGGWIAGMGTMGGGGGGIGYER